MVDRKELWYDTTMTVDMQTNKILRVERTHASNVYEQIRIDIINGTLPAASKLKTRILAERFDVGLSPIREALSRLSTEGWVRQSDRKGFSVVPVSVDELWDLHNARCMLNEAGLRASIKFGETAWEEDVLLKCIRISRTQRPADMTVGAEAEKWNVMHRAFHTSLISACKSKRIIHYCEQLFDEIERYRRLGLSSNNGRSRVADEHKEIADAAVARDPEQAVQLLTSHFTRTVEQVEQVIRHIQK